MKTFLKFASIPLVLFVALFALPRLVSVMFNAHSDVGILGILIIVCGICGVISKAAYDYLMKEIENDEA